MACSRVTIIALACFTVSGCADIAGQFDLNDNLSDDNNNAIDNDNGNNSNENSTDGNANDNVSDGVPTLLVSLGPDRSVSGSDEVEIEAIVTDAPDEEHDVYYFWQVSSEDTGAAFESSQTKDFVKDNTILIRPSELFDLVPGDRLLVEAEVQAVVPDAPEFVLGKGRGDVILTISEDDSLDDDPPDDDLDGTDDNSNSNDNDNGGDDVGNENDNGNDSLDNENDNGSLGGGGGGGGGSSGTDNGVCNGITDYDVILPADFSMFFDKGSETVSATVCNGSTPISYSWSPANQLEAPGLPGQGVGSVNVDTVDVTPLSRVAQSRSRSPLPTASVELTMTRSSSQSMHLR